MNDPGSAWPKDPEVSAMKECSLMSCLAIREQYLQQGEKSATLGW
jgi:hypothetical protein